MIGDDVTPIFSAFVCSVALIIERLMMIAISIIFFVN
jgi:hypothetical protein